MRIICGPCRVCAEGKEVIRVRKSTEEPPSCGYSDCITSNIIFSGYGLFNVCSLCTFEEQRETTYEGFGHSTTKVYVDAEMVLTALEVDLNNMRIQLEVRPVGRHERDAERFIRNI